jgi:CheY-like chemotaxis protein
VNTGSPALLVVDDNEDNRYTLTRRLTREGYTNLITATNGREALDLLQSKPFDLMLLDIMMPDMNGIEVLRELRANPLTERLPVIMHSALSDSEMEMRTRELGVADFWVKSIVDVISMENSLRLHLGKAA